MTLLAPATIADDRAVRDCELTRRARAEALRRYAILDTPPEQAFDDLCGIAARVCRAPIAVVNLIDETRQFFKAEIGLGVRETPLDVSICAHAILHGDMLVVPDTLLDPRFACNPLVQGPPHLRFYAGALLETPEGVAIGTICILDYVARPEGLSTEQTDTLRALARQVMTQLEHRRLLTVLSEREAELERTQEIAGVGGLEVDLRGGFRNRRSSQYLRLHGLSPDAASETHENWVRRIHPEDRLRVEGDFIAAVRGDATTYRAEYRIVRPSDGEVRWIDARAEIERDEAGQPVRLVGAHRDVTERRRAEDALRTNEQRLRAILETMPQIVWATFPNGSHDYYNGRWYEFTGLPEGSTEGGLWSALVHPEDREAAAEAWRHALATGEAYEVEYRLRHRSGEYRWVLGRALPVRDADGRIERWYGTCTDIDDQKTAQEALRVETREAVKSRAVLKAEKERLQKLFQEAPGFICVFSGPEHVFDFVNETFRRLFGRRTWIGASVRDAMPDLAGQGFYELLDKVYATGERFVAQATSVRFRASPSDDEEERFLTFIYEPTRDDDGVITGIFCEGYDVTERVRAERALQQSEARQRQIFNSATDYAIIATDLDGLVTGWNEGARRVLGWTDEEMIGQTTHRFYTPEDVAAGVPQRRREEALLRGVASEERWHRRKSGEQFWAVGEITPLRDDVGQIVGFVKVLRDQTGQRRAEERQRLLINELNHRVKNTLATVQSIARQTLKALPQADGTLATFEGRLMALAKAHDVLTRESWDGAELREIVAEAMAAHSHESDRFEMIGPELRLEPRTALAIAMAVHELATNAAKYGALSVPAGRVAVSWSVVPGDPRWLTFRWEEKNGPPVREPTHRGFGTRLVRSLASELGGEVRLAYEPSGVTCVVAAPLHDRPVIPEEGIVIA